MNTKTFRTFSFAPLHINHSAARPCFTTIMDRQAEKRKRRSDDSSRPCKRLSYQTKRKRDQKQPIWGLRRSPEQPDYSVINFTLITLTDTNVVCYFTLISSSSLPNEVVYSVKRGQIFETSFFSNCRFTATFNISNELLDFLNKVKDTEVIPNVIVRYCYLTSWKRRTLAAEAMERHIDHTTVPTTFQVLIEERSTVFSGAFPKNFYSMNVPIEDSHFWLMMKNY